MKNGGGHFAPELGGHFELESGAHFKLELGGQFDWFFQLVSNSNAIWDLNSGWILIFISLLLKLSFNTISLYFVLQIYSHILNISKF
jgi:hypothetical protein